MYINLLIIYCLNGLSVCEHDVCTTVYTVMWSSEDDFMRSVLSFHLYERLRAFPASAFICRASSLTLFILGARFHVAYTALNSLYSRDNLLILLPLPSECWYYRCVLLYLVDVVLENQIQGSTYSREAVYQLSYIPTPVDPLISRQCLTT